MVMDHASSKSAFSKTNTTEESLVAETTSLLKESFSNGSSNVINKMEVQLQSTRRQSNNCLDISKRNVFADKRTLCVLFLGALFTVSMLGVMISRPSRINSIDSDDDFDKVIIPPLSLLDPVRDLGLAEHGRPRDDSSYPAYYYENDKNRPRKGLPTNAWYQNMLQAPQNDEPSNLQRTYPGPYLVDVVGSIPGLRVHAADIDASDMVMQLSFRERYSLVLGGTDNILSTADGGDGDEGSTTTHSHKYKVAKTTPLGITIEWDAMKMESNIVKGMPFVTMEYKKQKGDSGNILLPSIAAPTAFKNLILVDGVKTTLDYSKKVRVEKDMELYFPVSDHTWMIFFSEPVWIQSSLDNETTLLQVVAYDEDAADDSCSSTSDRLIVRAAIIDQCTHGINPISCRQGLGHRLPDEPVKDDYRKLLRSHVDTYPGRDTSFSYIMSDEDGDDEAMLLFDWDARSMSDLCRKDPSSPSANDKELLTFAIPHQMERLPSRMMPNMKRYCKSGLTGPTCLLKGKKWVLPQELPKIGFRAKRPPKPQYIPTLAKALSSDIEFQMPDYFKRGAGDTYFSGKLLAKLARILLISEEVDELCGENGGRDYLQFCKNSTLPTRKQVEGGIRELREGVEVWINGTAETPFVYDTSWGGVVSCGCYMEGTECTNRFPDCPAFGDPGLNFGNAFYNDHHFHYGYHIFAASVVAHFDKAWAMDNFENVLMLVRDIANPSEEDTSFPLFRHKDWYMGSSWASGVPYPAFLNGKNQESSSEAIAAYEAVALFGQVMNEIWEKEQHEGNAAVSKQIANVGKLMAGTELVSAKRYWHIPDEKDGDVSKRIYPAEYRKKVIGMLWQTMAQYGTWFGSAAYLPIGIQLLPLTPISEDRDGIDWMNSVYKPLTYACATDFQCTESGWSILQLATLATVGYAAEAVMKVKELPDTSFTNAGGNGHSRSNTIWYLSTRPYIENPIPMLRYDKRGKKRGSTEGFIRSQGLLPSRHLYRRSPGSRCWRIHL